VRQNAAKRHAPAQRAAETVLSLVGRTLGNRPD
jgi:hypothetical protein